MLDWLYFLENSQSEGVKENEELKEAVEKGIDIETIIEVTGLTKEDILS